MMRTRGLYLNAISYLDRSCLQFFPSNIDASVNAEAFRNHWFLLVGINIVATFRWRIFSNSSVECM